MWPNRSALPRAIIPFLFVAAVSYGSVLTYRMPRVNMGPPALPRNVSSASVPRPLDTVAGFRCLETGSFPVPGSCQDFYHCEDLPGHGLMATLVSCPSGFTFDDLLDRCHPRSLVTTRPDCIGNMAQELEFDLDNVNQTTDVAVTNSLPLMRQKRFAQLFSCFLCSQAHAVDFTEIQHRLDGIVGKMNDLDSSLLKSRLESTLTAHITQNLIQKGIQQNRIAFQGMSAQEITSQGTLENRINTALTQGLIVQGNIANEMNFERVQGSIGEVRKLIEKKMNDAKSVMERGFESISTAIDRARTEPLISIILTVIKGFNERVQHLFTIPKQNLEDEMTKDGGFIAYLKSNLLEEKLSDVINQNFAIPSNVSDVSSTIMLDLLVEGYRIHTNMQTSIISSYIYLAGEALKIKNLEDFDINMKRAISAISAMNVNLGYGSDSGLSKEVSQVLDKVQAVPFFSQFPGLAKLLSERRTDLEETATYIEEFNARHTYLKEPGSITKKLDFSDSTIELPVGPWRRNAMVQYAIQLASDDAVSEIGRWSTKYTVYKKANPIVHLPSAGVGIKRLVYRMFDDGTPELVAVVTDREQSSFRDIERDILIAAARPNEELAQDEVKALLEEGADINISLEDGITPLLIAAQSGNLDVIKMLLENGADLHAKASDDEQAHHFAALRDHGRVLDFLISKGLFVDARTKSLGWTPLHVAAANDYGDATRALIANGASINAKDNSGITPLHLATLGNGVALDILLAEDDIEVNAKANDGQTPLHYSAKSSSAHITQKLLEHPKIEINAYADGLLSPLHYAAMSGSEDTIGSLIHHGASPFIFDKEGSGPLHYAAFYGNENTVTKLLTEEQLVESAKNWEKKYALDLAVETKKPVIMSKLRSSSKIMNDDFGKKYQVDTGISLLNIDCTHGLAEEMATGSEETCMHVGHITNYVDVITSKPLLAVHEYHREFIHIVTDYNSALQKAKNNALGWKQEAGILQGIQQAFTEAKKFEASLEKMYTAKQKRLGTTLHSTVSDKLRETIAFLEQVKNDASNVKQMAMNAKQKYVTFRIVLESNLELLRKSNQDAIQFFKTVQNHHIAENMVLKYFLERQDEMEEVIAREKQQVPDTYDQIFKSYESLRDIRMQLVHKIEHVPTQRFATTLPSPLTSVIAEPLFTLESSSVEGQITTQKNSIEEARAKIQTFKSQVKAKESLADDYQTLIFSGLGYEEAVVKAHNASTRVECSLRDFMEIVPRVRSSLAGTLASLESVENAFQSITLGITDLINKGQTAASETEKENALDTINTDLAKLSCHWRHTGVLMADIQECSKNFYFIYPESELVHNQC